MSLSTLHALQEIHFNNSFSCLYSFLKMIIGLKVTFNVRIKIYRSVNDCSVCA